MANYGQCHDKRWRNEWKMCAESTRTSKMYFIIYFTEPIHVLIKNNNKKKIKNKNKKLGQSVFSQNTLVLNESNL